MKGISFFVFLIFYSILSQNIYPQSFIGTVKDRNGNSIGNVSIFNPETLQSFSSNRDGCFEVKLPKGKYTLVFQDFLHQKKILNIEIPQENKIDVFLENRKMLYPDSLISQSKNIVDAIMQKTILFAQLYEWQFSQFTYTSYIRGLLKIIKLNFLIKSIEGTRIKKSGIREGDEFIQEMINVAKLKNGEMDKKLIAISDNFPQNIGLDVPLSLVNNISLRSNEMFITPLASNAFKYYNFIYNGSFIEDGRTVNKIFFLPKGDNSQLVSGYICVFDKTWNIHSFEISGSYHGKRYTFKQMLAPIAGNAMLPVQNQVSMDVFFAGSKGEFFSISSNSYSNIKTNWDDALKKMDEISKRSGVIKRGANIKELFAKAYLTNTDVKKLKRNMSKIKNKIIKEEYGKTKISSYEIADFFDFEVNDVKTNLPSQFWDSVRTIPLMNFESRSIGRSDSIRVKNFAKNIKREQLMSKMKILFGGEYKIDASNSIIHNGIINSSIDFNTVDAFNYGQKISYSRIFPSETSFVADAEAIYSFGRKRLLWELDLAYNYYPEKRAKIKFSYGRKTMDFNDSGTGVNPTSNAISSLFFKRNYINFYGKHFIGIGNEIDLFRGLTWTMRFSYQRRKRLYNNTNFSFFKRGKEFRSNSPINPYVYEDSTVLATSKAYVIETELSYTPCQYYKMNGRTKTLLYSDYPTISLAWKRGLSGIFKSVSNFDLLTLDVSHKIRMGQMENISYFVRAAKFFNRKKMHFSEFAHFNLSEDDFMFSPFDGLQDIIQTYYSSTNEWYWQANFVYTTPNLLLRRFFFKNFFMQENIYLNYLDSPQIHNYFEIGYGLSNIFGIFGAGVFWSLESLEYKFIRIKLSLDIGK